MRRQFVSVLLATTSLVAFADVGFAADIPPRVVTKAPAVAPVAYYNWTGCYLGGHAGWGWGRKDVSAGNINSIVTGNALFSGFRDEIDGFLGGVQAGCNYQVNPNWVFGIEGQWSWSNLKGDFFRDPFFSNKGATPTPSTFSVRTDWLGTLAARFGYTWDRWMLYGKAGFAWAHDKYSFAGIILGTPVVIGDSETRTGWMLGVGVEHAFWNNWSAKLEYNYMDFGNERVTLAGLALNPNLTVPTSSTVDIDQRIHVVKIGLNYRFGDFGKGPMVARY